MRQSELDLVMNEVLDTVFNCNISDKSKKKMLLDIKGFFVNYSTTIESVEKDEIIRFNDTVEKN